MNSWTLAATLIASTVPIAGLGLAAYVVDFQKRTLAGEKEVEASSQAKVSSPSRKFARDVAVNVVANLAAAAIVYLLASVFGLLPRSPYLILTALTVLALTAGLGLGAVGLALRGKAKIYTLGTALVVMGASGLLVPFIRDSGLTGWEKSWLPVASLGSLSMDGLPLSPLSA